MILTLGLATREDLPGREIFDCIVFGNVLCEVPDQKDTCWFLGPGDRFVSIGVFLGHTCYTENGYDQLRHAMTPQSAPVPTTELDRRSSDTWIGC